MTYHGSPHRPQEHPSSWWVLAAWASLLLVVAGGLAGAAGIG